MKPIESITSIFKMDYEVPDKNNNKRLYCVYGFVENDGKPLSNVDVRSLKSFTQTNHEGFFKIYVKKKDILKPILFKREGYEDEEIKITKIQNKVHRWLITMNNVCI